MVFKAGWGARHGLAKENRFAHEAGEVHALSVAARDGPAHVLTEQLLLARSNLRRACSLGDADGSAARAPALVALARAADIALGQAPTLLQLKAALGMHAGYAVELGFIDGRPLAVALAAILHVWSGRHCHIVSAAEHLAAVDAAALAPLYQVCGVSADVLTPTALSAEATDCYALDIVYATGRQLLSDFMRDSLLLAGAVSPMRRRLQSRKLAGNDQRPVTRGLDIALIDNIEAALVDEAASPVVISAAGNATVLHEATVAAASMVAGLLAGRDYQIATLHGWQVQLTEAGQSRLVALGMALPVFWQHPQRRFDLVSNALLARDTLELDRHYVVQEGRLMLADESVFRLLAGRVWHNGLLQALELRNGLPLSTPPRTVARATLQTFFPRYLQLAGAGSSLNGLGKELRTCYGLRVLKLAGPGVPVVPLAARRYGYRDRAAKLDGFIALIESLHEGGAGAPLLISAPRTADLAVIGRVLIERAVPFQAVDGRNPASDAATLAAANTPGAVTIITGPAARNGALAAAGSPLHALLFEHGESRRADDGFFARAGFGIVFASIDDDVLLRPLPAWAGPLRLLAARIDADSGIGRRTVQALITLSQWHGSQHRSGYRRSLALRENQLDEQLAFSGKG